MTGAHKLAPNRSIPDVTVIPELAYADLDRAVSWLCNAFGFQERLRIADHVFGDRQRRRPRDLGRHALEDTLNAHASGTSRRPPH